MLEPAPSEPDTTRRTSIRIREALTGDPVALEWVIVRLSPLLLCQARWRMGARLLGRTSPEDVVAEVWQRALPRLTRELLPAAGPCARRVVRFLSTVVIHRINELLRELMSKPSPRSFGLFVGDGADRSACEPVVAGSSVWRPVLARDAIAAVEAALRRLGPKDQEIIILRRIEDLSSRQVAKRLDVSVQAVDTRLSRALERLRLEITDGVLDELDRDDEAATRVGGTPRVQPPP